MGGGGGGGGSVGWVQLRGVEARGSKRSEIKERRREKLTGTGGIKEKN